MRFRSFALAPLLALFGCQALFTEPTPSAVHVRVDASRFTRDPATSAASVGFSAQNNGGVTVYLARCGDRLMAAVDRWQGNRWLQYSGDACQTAYNMSPLPLSVGEEHHSARSVHEVGRYRLRLGIGGAPDTGSAWTAASEPFIID